MKIAQVCHRYYPYIGGVETHVEEISKRLVRKGFDVEVLTTDSSGRLASECILNGVKVRRFRCWAPNDTYYFSRSLRIYLTRHSDSYDLVHAHHYSALPAFYTAQTKNTNRLVFTPHYHGGGSTFFRNLLYIPYKILGGKIFKKADRIICVSNYEKTLVMDNFRVEEEKISVIPNGLNIDEFKDISRKRKDYKTILYVGRLEKHKGLNYVIEALAKLDNDVFFEIVGVGSHKNALVKLANKLEVRNRIKFHRHLPRNQLLQKYADADVFVLLSRREAYGIGVAEALSSGTPCIVANASALTEWVDGKDCFGIDYPPDINEVIRLIREVIGKKVSGANLRARAPSWNEIVDNLVKVYEYSKSEVN